MAAKTAKKISKVTGVTAQKIKEASKRIRPLVLETPLEKSNALSKRYGANVYIKHE